MLTVHPAVRAQAMMAASAFLAGALVGLLAQAVEEVARARRHEREQLQNAGAVLDTIERDRDMLRQRVDQLGAAIAREQLRAAGAESAQMALNAAIVEHRCTPGAVIDERDQALYAAAAQPPAPEPVGDELVRDAIALSRSDNHRGELEASDDVDELHDLSPEHNELQGHATITYGGGHYAPCIVPGCDRTLGDPCQHCRVVDLPSRNGDA